MGDVDTVTVDLGTEETIHACKVVGSNALFIVEDFEVLWSNDNVTYTNATTVTGNTQQVAKVTFEQPVTARYFKFIERKGYEVPGIGEVSSIAEL